MDGLPFIKRRHKAIGQNSIKRHREYIVCLNWNISRFCEIRGYVSLNNMKYFEKKFSEFAETRARKRECKAIDEVAMVEALNILKLYRLNQEIEFLFVYDNRFCPPTYGDLFPVLMCVRLMKNYGMRCRFHFVDEGVQREDWKSSLSHWAISDFLSDQQDLSNYILGSRVTHLDKFDLINEFESIENGYVVFEQQLQEGEGIYRFAWALMTYLVDAKGIPNYFFLDNISEFSQSDIQNSFIAINFRMGIWDLTRNPSIDSLIRDVEELSSIFPDTELRIFSSSNGLVTAREALSDSYTRCQISFQRSSNFVDATKEVLKSKYYFQRLGGGMSVGPMFSRVPYLVLSPWAGWVSYAYRNRFPIWANTNQKYYVLRKSNHYDAISNYL